MGLGPWALAPAELRSISSELDILDYYELHTPSIDIFQQRLPPSSLIIIL